VRKAAVSKTDADLPGRQAHGHPVNFVHYLTKFHPLRQPFSAARIADNGTGKTLKMSVRRTQRPALLAHVSVANSFSPGYLQIAQDPQNLTAPD
jgi:hypothetical protein